MDFLDFEAHSRFMQREIEEIRIVIPLAQQIDLKSGRLLVVLYRIEATFRTFRIGSFLKKLKENFCLSFIDYSGETRCSIQEI